jgi:hypothetical protein
VFQVNSDHRRVVPCGATSHRLGLGLRMVPLACLICLALLSGGCNKPAKKSEANSSTSSKDTNRGADVLDGVINQLLPENLGFDSDLGSAISLLNSWHSLTPAKSEQQATGTLSSEGLAAELKGLAELPEVTRPEFSSADGQHLRDSILFASIADFIQQSEKTDLARVQAAFSYTIRNVALLDDGEEPIPLGPFETLLLGRGSAAQRAWVFASILRQLRIDAVILATGTELVQPSNGWLIGVPLSGEVYLFDPGLGLPIPSSSDGGEKIVAATLSQVIKQPELLSGLSLRSVDPYHVKAEDLPSAKVYLIVEPIRLSQRYFDIEQNLPPNRTLVLADRLIGDEIRPGIIGRLQKEHPDWGIDRFGLWPFPKSQEDELENMTQVLAQRMQSALMPLNAPIVMEPAKGEGGGKGKNEMVATPTRRQFKNRIDQLRGLFEETLPKYVTVRQAATFGIRSQEIQQLHQLAAEDAHYFSAVCQFERQQYGPAADLLSAYLKQYGRGRWRSAARLLKAEAQIRIGQTAEAVETLNLSIADDSNDKLCAYLSKRLGGK